MNASTSIPPALATLLEQHERQRDALLATRQQADENVNRLQQQAQQLAAYRQDTGQRHPAQGGRSSSMAMLHVHQAFVARLDQAIEQQQGQLLAAHQRAAQLRRELLALETRIAAVRKLCERRADQARQQEARRDQRRTDEAASRSGRARALDGTWSHTTSFHF
jgi:flagellar FliJ protein